MYSVSLQGLRVFCAVARSGSFKTAAAKIFVSPSAISHRIKALEEQFGSPLFERKTRSINLTRFGEAVFSKISPLIDEIDKELSELAEIADAESIKITLPPFFSTEVFLPRLQKFTAENKNIIITLDTQDQHPEKHLQGSNLSILVSNKQPEAPCAVELLSLDMVPACSPRLNLEPDDLSSEMLSNITLLIHGARKNAWQQWFKQYGKENMPLRNVIVLDTMLAVVRAAEQGLGLALVPDLLVGRWIDDGSLVKYSGYKLATKDSYYLVTDSENLNRPQVAKLTKWIIEIFQ